jgi:hypothetical protein
MALLGDRYEVIQSIDFFMDATAERGGCATQLTAGSGVSLDQAAHAVSYAAAPSGYTPVGILLNDVVNLDLTRQHINFHKNEVQQGGKVTILQEGWVVTNMVYPGVTPAAQDLCYVSLSGYLNTTAESDQSAANSSQPIGRFMSTKDEDGFVKVYVKLPTVGVPA